MGGRRGSLYANLQLPNKPNRPHIPSSDGKSMRAFKQTCPNILKSGITNPLLDTLFPFCSEPR